MQDSTTEATPITVKEPITSVDEQPMDETKFRQIVGSLHYLTFTSSDITHAINKVCQKF